MNIVYCLCALLLSISFSIQGQEIQPILTTEPALPSADDSVTIIYDALQGNKGLVDYPGKVYMHTGAIMEAGTAGGWKYVVGVWGKQDPKVEMERAGRNLYKYRMHIRSFYGIPQGEAPQALAFVFRNEDGTKVGKTDKDGDIYIDCKTDQQAAPPINVMDALGRTVTIPDSEQVLEGFYQDSSELVLRLTNYRITITSYGKNILRVALNKRSSPALNNPYSIIGEKSGAGYTSIDYGNHMDFRRQDNDLIIRVAKSPARLLFLRGDKILMQEKNGLFEQAASQALSISLRPGEAIFGGGSRALPMNKRGLSFPMYNSAVYGYTNGTPQLNIAIPYFVSSYGYGIYIDSHAPLAADLGQSNRDILKIAAESGELSYFLLWGDTYADMATNYARLTGFQPLPPLWSLGYIQSKYGYQNQDETLDIAQKMKKGGYPIDGLVLDLYWFGKKELMGNLDWEKTAWPNPEKMIRTLDTMGIHTILITEPYFTRQSSTWEKAAEKGLFATAQDGSPYIIKDFWAGQASLLDIYKPEARQWMQTFYADRMRQGVSGWWCDLGEPESHPAAMQHSMGSARHVHNLYSLFWMEMLHSLYESQFNGKRLFNLIRSGAAGMQRYAAFPWSGDVQRSYSGLAAQIPIMLSMGMNGVGYMHSDLGGFTGGARNDVLYTRWLQFGAFSPIMRVHGEGVPPEPVFYPDSVQNIIRKFARLRMRFLPYNYTLAWQNSTKGYPFARPIFWYFPANSILENLNDQYLWGENLLIAPVVEKSATRQIMLPPGQWYDFWTHKSVSGSFEYTVPLHTMPIYARAGSIIPLGPEIQNTAAYKADTFTVQYFRSGTNSFTEYTLYTDNGISSQSLTDSAYRLLILRADEDLKAKKIAFRVQNAGGKGYKGEPQRRRLHLSLINTPQKPLAILADNKPVMLYADEASFLKAAQPAAWYKAANPDSGIPGEIHIRYIMSGSSAPMILVQELHQTGAPQKLQNTQPAK